MAFPVVKGVSYGLAHTPGLVRHGSKPRREIAAQGAQLQGEILSHLRTFDEAVGYPPNQVYIGNLRPDDLHNWPKPYHLNPLYDATPAGRYGQIIPEWEFLARMLRYDHFDLLWLNDTYMHELQALCCAHLSWPSDTIQSVKSQSESDIAEQINRQGALPLFVDGDRLVGCVRRAHESDEALTAEVLVENLACKVTAIQAVQSLLASYPDLEAGDIDYVIGCGEEAIGDRYQRGGGNLAKAVAEDAGCMNATGSDTKAFCCAPVHALVIAGALVQAGVFKNIVVIGGCSQAKLGMKFQGHLKHDMPIIEDSLASVAVWIGPDDGKNPQLRLDRVGRHSVGAGSSTVSIAQASVVAPLEMAKLRMVDIDKFAVELHNPEVTEPQGNGNVPLTNYRLLASLAVARGEIERNQMMEFIEERGLPGYAPTQGHIPSAISYIGHARDALLSGRMQRVMFVAKGSLFLGRLTQLADGISVMLESNSALSHRD